MDDKTIQNPTPTDAAPTASKPRRKPRGLKIALIVILALFLLGAGVLYFLPHFLPMDTIRSIANSQARQYGLNVDFSGLGFSWDGKVVLENISVARLDAAGEPEEPLLKVNEVRTNVAVSPLLHGKIVVNSVDVNGFSARVAREADGSLNLPDFSQFASLPPDRAAPRSERRMLLAAPAATSGGLPPIEIHEVNLNNGLLAFDDKAENLSLEVGLDFLKIQGAGLDDPFSLAGRLLPYPGAASKGEIPFTGRIAMLKGGALNLDGEATFEAELKAFTVDELVRKLGFGDLLRSGTLDGVVKAAYAERKGRLAVSEMQVRGAAVGLEQNRVVNLPDSSIGVNAEFDPEPGSVTFSDFSLRNDINNLKANGWIRGVYDALEGGLPAAGIEFSGVADFAKALAYAEALDLGLDGLPEIGGSGNYFGNVSLAKAEGPGSPVPVTLAIDFSDGELAATEAATGIAANVKLSGVGVRAAANLGDVTEVNSNVTLKNVPIDARVPQIGGGAVNLTINGGVALAAAGEAAAVELRLQNTRANIPATPWAEAMILTSPETQLTYDLQRDQLNIAAMTFDINDGVKGGVKAAVITGILAGNPQGQADMDISTLLETVKKLFHPLVPEMAAKMAGSLRAATRVKLEGRQAEALIQAEIDNADLLINIEPQAQAAATTPKTTVGLLASVDLDNPGVVAIQALEMNNSESVLRVVEKEGHSLSGRFGATAVKLAGVVDTDGMRGDFSNLSVAGGGMSLVLGQGSQQIAGLESGAMQVVAATDEARLQVPLGATGAFNLPSLDAAVNNFVFYIPAGENGRQRQNSDFGNLRAKLGVDGHLGEGQPQVVNVRTASLTAKMLAVNSRGSVDLGTGALSAQYAGRLMPAGLGPLLNYLQLPPTLLDDAAVSGALAWNGAQLDSKGNAQGRLRLASGEINPFEMVHDLSAAINREQKSLAVSIRRLDGNVKTGSGEAVVTLAAQPSNLLLSRDGSKGLVDIRLNGAAASTRQLALGLTGVLPQLREVSAMLNSMQANGVYSAWLQVSDKDSTAIGVKTGGVWQGAALQIDKVPYLAESGKLSAALEGEFAFRENRITLSRVLLRSDSAVAQADGTAQVLLTADADRNITGVGRVNVDLRYTLADLAKLPLAFPGVVPSDLGLAGKVDGTFKAGGDAHDIRVSEGVAKFTGVKLNPGADIAIPQGTANFDATISLVAATPKNMAGTAYDVFRLFNIANGKASLTGAQIQAKPVENMSGSFELNDGVLTLKNGQLKVQGQDGGAVAASGTVDFKPKAPAAALQIAVSNFPMSVVNKEIQEYFTIDSGVISLPAQGKTASVAFSGFSEDEILRTLKLGNFNFATGPTTILTGSLLNTELDKARGLMRQEVEKSGQARRITLKSITGTATADGKGQIVIPKATPINVVGDNTGDFRVQGSVSANHTMDLEFLIVGKLENLIGFTLPNLIPNLRQGTDEQKSRFMERMNQNAAKGHYKVRLRGPLDNPDLSGIGEVAGRFLTDIFAAAPAEILGGVVNLGKDAPGAILDAAGAILNPENVTNPSNIIKAPENLGKNIGKMFGIGGGSKK